MCQAHTHKIVSAVSILPRRLIIIITVQNVQTSYSVNIIRREKHFCVLFNNFKKRENIAYIGKYPLEPKHMIQVLFCFNSVCFLSYSHAHRHKHCIIMLYIHINNINVAETGFLYRFNSNFHTFWHAIYTHTCLWKTGNCICEKWKGNQFAVYFRRVKLWR